MLGRLPERRAQQVPKMSLRTACWRVRVQSSNRLLLNRQWRPSEPTCLVPEMLELGVGPEGHGEPGVLKNLGTVQRQSVHFGQVLVRVQVLGGRQDEKSEMNAVEESVFVSIQHQCRIFLCIVTETYGHGVQDCEETRRMVDVTRKGVVGMPSHANKQFMPHHVRG